jgi:hypothetical protein
VSDGLDEGTPTYFLLLCLRDGLGSVVVLASFPIVTITIRLSVQCGLHRDWIKQQAEQQMVQGTE